MRVLLIAHGATAATRAAAFPQDEPLEQPAADDASELGRRWSRSRARADQWPRNPARATAVCGPERRCEQTATRLGLSAVADPALADWNHGEWAGAGPGDLDPQHLQSWLSEPDFIPPGGESRQHMLTRISTWLDGLDATSLVIAVTHPAVLRAAALHALSAAPEAFWRIDVPPLATLALSGQGGRWNIRLSSASD